MQACCELDPRRDFCCTASKDKDEYKRQHWYNCLTCCSDPHLGVCDVCAVTCHKGHDLVERGVGGFYCDCGAGSMKNPCKCLTNEAGAQVEVAPKCLDQCTFAVTGQNMQLQKLYMCIGPACNMQEGQVCCATCARICHSGEGHALIDVGIQRGYCDCASGKFGPCKCQKKVDFQAEKVLPPVMDYCCTHEYTKDVPFYQKLWHCETCHMAETDGVCDVCADTCHKDHEMEEIIGHVICKCGPNCKCTVPDTSKNYFPGLEVLNDADIGSGCCCGSDCECGSGCCCGSDCECGSGCGCGHCHHEEEEEI